MADLIAAVVVAGGRGLRAGGDVPKQYRELAGEPVIRPALLAFLIPSAGQRGATGHSPAR